ncbi:translocation/assembly module TamB domain-containing protein [Halomonas chromatireducens]|uniref:Translocation and assembly module TamB n=1 Tax=Halomonas chromatireducens TaxID=507626 RepID=A0A0X8HE51_9GAMM|nr:translocation/assembly module TamB domain-containing protein [Halomonas chromatireducens]AMD00962.1 Translocation and assembly module TamB [Halomonas chromatireducens]
MAPSFRHRPGILRTRLLLWSLLRLFILLPLWLLGLVLLALGLALSPWGAGLLLEQGAERGFYQLEDAEGAPLDRLVLHGLELEAGPARVSLRRLDLAWADDCLLRGKLCIEHLAVEGARIHLKAGGPAAEREAEREPAGDIRLPFPVEIRALSLIDVELELADGTRVVFDDFSSAARASASELELLSTRLEGLRVSLPASPGTELAPAITEEGRQRLSAPAIDAAIELADTPPRTLEAGEEDTGATRQPIHLPLSVTAPDLQVVDTAVELGDGTRIELDTFTSGIEAAESHLDLLPTRLAGLRIRLPLSPGAQLALEENDTDAQRLSAETIDATLALASPLPAAVVAEVDAILALTQRERIGLPEIHLPLSVSMPHLRLEEVEFTGPVDYAIRHLTLGLEASGQEVEVTSLDLATLDADAHLSARVTLRGDYPLTARLRTTLWLPEIMPELAGQRLELLLSGSLGDLEAELAATGPVKAELRARFDALEPTLPFTASLESDLIQWPLPMRLATEVPEDEEDVLVDPFLIEDLSLRLSGSLLDYSAALSMQVEGPEIPRTRVALSGSGDFEHFSWLPLSLTLGDASLITRGRVDWTDGVDVGAVIRLDNIDPGTFTDATDGRLSGDIEVAFAQGLHGWQLDVPRLDISGELQSLPMSLQARLSGDSEMRWEIDRFEFRQADNRLSASGAVTEQSMSLDGEIDLPNLSNLHDDLTGSLAGQFTTSGSLEAPQIDIELLGDSLAFSDNRLESLGLSGSVRGLDDPALDLRLDIENLNAGGQRFSEISLLLDGHLSDHALTLDAIAGRGMPLSQASMVLEGGLSQDRQRYTGSIHPLEVSAEYGDIRLDEPLSFSADLETGSARVQPFCLSREQGGSICLDETLQASAESGDASLSVRGLPMELLDEWLPEEWRATGQTDMNLQAQWRRGGAQWRLQSDLESDLSLHGMDIYGQPWSLPATQLRVNVDASQQRVDLELDLSLADAGRVQLRVGQDDPAGDGALEGTLTLDTLDLSRYRTLAAGMDTLEGVIDGRVDISGTGQSPQLNGALELSGLEASGMDIPLIIVDGRIRVEFDGETARIMGYVESDEGRLVINGDAAWPSPDDWRIGIDLDGTRQPLLVTMPEFGRLRIAPDLRVRIDPTQLQVRGAVQVPWARLEIGDTPPAAVSPSPDEIIITRRDDARARRTAELEEEAGADEAATVALQQAGMSLDVRIDLNLGPDMQFEARGLETGLRGTLQVRQQDGPVQLFGDVILTDGRFRAFGQDLMIRQGQLLFSGPPDQPLLDFEAIRNPDLTDDGVIAGLRVSGFAAEPALEIFSEPAMDEASALSYLLRGRAPRDGDADGALTAALVGLTLGQTGGAVGAIGQAFGIDDLALETAGMGDESQVVVTGYLTEDLRISYGVGIFSPIAELTLRYTLWRNLYVQAVSGAAQAVDLVYTFSRPGQPPQLDSGP